MNFSQDSILAAARPLVSAIVGYLVGRALVTEEQGAFIVAAALGLIPVFLSAWGAYKARPSGQIATVQKLADTGALDTPQKEAVVGAVQTIVNRNGLDPSTKAAIIQTAASLPDVRKVVTHDSGLADASPSNKVRAQ